MDEFLILLQAKLDEAKSKGNVNADIEKLQNQLNKLKVQVEIDPKATQKLANDIGKLVNQKIIISNIGINQNNLSKTGQQIGQVILDGAEKAIGDVTSKVIGKGFTVSSAMSKKVQSELESIVKDWTNNKGKVNSITIDTKTDFNEKTLENIEQLKSATVQYSNELGQVITKTLKYKQVGVNTFANGETEAIKGWVESASTYKATLESTSKSTNNFVAQQKKAVTDLTNQVNQIYKSAIDQNASKPIKDSTNLSNLENKYNDIITAIGKMGNASEAAFTDERNSVNTLISDLKIVVKEYKNAETAATSMRSKDVGTIKSVKTNELDEFIAKIQNSKVPIKEMRSEIANLKTSLSSIHDTDTLTAYLNQFDIANSKFKSLKEQFAKSESLSSVIFNPVDLEKQGKVYIQRVRNTIEAIKPELESKLRNAGYSDIEIKGVENAKGKIKSLTATITDATGAFKQLNFERAKIQGSNQINHGFIQTDDVKVIGNISSEIGKVQNSLSTLKTKWEEQGVLVGEFRTKVGQLESSLSSVGNKGELDGLKTQIQDLKNEASTLSRIHEIQLSMDTGETESKIGALISRTNQWTDTNGNARISTQSLTDALDKLGIASNEYLKIPTEEKQKSLIEANEQLSIEYKKVASEVRSMNAEFAKDSAIDSLRQQYQTFYSENGKAHKQFGSQLKSAMSELAHGAEVPKQRVAELKRELLDTKNVCKELGLTGQTWFQNLGDKIKQLSTYLSGTVIIGKLLQSGKQIVDNVLKVDVSLVELEKVSDLTADGLEKVTDRAFELGKSLAKTGTDVLDAVTTFKRAGYDIEESMNYAEQALKTTNISENIQDAGQAADSLVNIMKGFQNESPEFAKKINDAVNQVSNTEAVDFDNLIDGATRLSAVADQAGMSFEQMLGTLTGGYEILGNMEKVATGQITIFSRLQAIQLDGEEEVSTVAKLQETFNNATKGAVNIVDQTTGQLRNVYDILDDVANVWYELDKNTREALAIEAAGIRQKNVFLAMMQNWEGVKDAVESASDSVGSADVENEKYIKSIQGRVENFERSVQQLSRTVLDSDIIKWFVDLGTTGVNAIDKIVNTFGSLGTIGLGAGLFKIFKNVDYLKTPVCPLYI